MRDAVALRRSAAVAHALLVVAAAYSGALAVNAAVALWLEAGIPVASQAAVPPPEAETVERTMARTDYAAIFDRNLFGSEPVVVVEPGATAGPSTLDIRLRGTAKIDGRGFAVFEDGAGERQDVFAIGEKVFGGPKLVAVKPGRATVIHKGRKHTLEIADTQPVRTQEVSQKRTGATAKPTGINRTGDGVYAVDRREVEHAIENLNEVITQMRAVPFLKDGKSLGFRIFNIRPSSIFERMGLENGDVVQSVNGVDLNSPSQAIGLLDSMRTADQLTVNLLRGNQPSTLTYAIR